MNYEEAVAMRDSLAVHDAKKAIIASLLGGAALRGAFGLYGLNARNIRRKKERDEIKPNPGEVPLPAKAAADNDIGNIPRPWWYTPAAVLGPPAGFAAGWAGVGALLKRYRKQREREELAKAKEEFEAALADERSSKFACELHDLAQSYVSGDLDADLEKSATFIDWVGNKASWVGPALATLAIISGSAGALGGWKLRGNSGEQAKVKAYREAMRRKRISRPSSLMARPAATPTDDQGTKADSDDNDASEKTASFGNTLKSVGKYVGIPAASAVGTGLVLTETPLGKWYLQNRMHRLLQDNSFVDSTINDVISNPKVRKQVANRLMPAMYRQFMQQHPVLSSIAKFMDPSFKEQARRGFVS